MSDQEVIELLSSSDEASSSDSQSSRARRRSPSSSNDEEGKAQLKPSRRRLVRTSSVSSSGQRRKRHASSSSASSQEESDDSAEEHETVVQLKRPVKKPKVAATKNYVAPTPRPRADRRAAGEMRQITEGMSFYELQAQEQMMARFQNQNRRKAPATKPQAELQAQERAIKQFHRQKARKSAPYAYTTTPVKKLVDPVIHSTAWRRLVFEEAPPNILHAVSTTPFSTGFDKPLWEYDPKGELKKKCKFVAAAGQGVAITEENFASQSPSQSEVNTRIHESKWTGILRPIKFFVASGTGVYSGRKLRIISHG
ncbi:hypothetical protein PF010_g8036 [Phytophthora fragariae]|uniref:Uncharacterized protein n=1 Tax=Phytophthora fragariae TaxID=53985 RepID=A0A6G0LGI7_9STRA|nr:hypothetical protein PF010_g8036 [Phytophthora fragariae]